MSRSKEIPILSQQKIYVLNLLYDFHCLDTEALHRTVNPNLTQQAFSAILSGLRQDGLLLRHDRLGRKSLYTLTKLGCEAIGKEITSVHRRKPTNRTLETKKAQLLVESEAQKRGLIIYRATSASPFSKVQAYQSEVRRVLEQHFLETEKQLIAEASRAGYDVSRRQRDLVAGVTPVPRVFREYYIHYPSQPGVILIVSHPRSDRRFWLAKCEELKSLTSHFPILCVFAVIPPADLLATLKSEGFIATTLEMFGDALTSLLPPPTNQI